MCALFKKIIRFPILKLKKKDFFFYLKETGTDGGSSSI